MKKLTALAVACAVAGLLLLPQVSSAAQPKFGLKVGLNSADITGADLAAFESLFEAPFKPKIGFCGGGFVVFALSKGMAIQVEALYTQKGAKAEGMIDLGAGPEPFTVSWNTDYIEIPVLFKYVFETKGNLKPVLFAGPSVAFKMTAKLKASVQGQSDEMNIPGFKSTDFGLVFGGGLDIGPKIRVDLRYILGLTKLVDMDGTTADIKNGVFSLMVGYAF